jgi:deoxycytidylate deaminase
MSTRAVDREFIYFAEKVARKSRMRHKIGAILVWKKQVISTGYNRWSGLENEETVYGVPSSWSLHAELDCIRRGLSFLHDHKSASLTMYVVRKNYRLSMPCPNCTRMIFNTPNIKRIIYSNGFNDNKELEIWKQ